MGKKAPARGHHGLGARGQGKPLFMHTQAALAIRAVKAESAGKVHRQPEARQPDGHWKR